MRAKRAGSAAIGRGLPAAVLGCMVCLLGAPAASAAVWLPPQNLSASGRDATNPVVAMDDGGGTTAIWEKDNTTNAELSRRGLNPQPGRWLFRACGIGRGGHRTSGGDNRRRAGGRRLEATCQSPWQLRDSGRDPIVRERLPASGGRRDDAQIGDPERYSDRSKRQWRHRRRLDAAGSRLRRGCKRHLRRGIGPPRRRQLLPSRQGLADPIVEGQSGG